MHKLKAVLEKIEIKNRKRVAVKVIETREETFLNIYNAYIRSSDYFFHVPDIERGAYYDLNKDAPFDKKWRVYINDVEITEGKRA